MMPQEKMHLIVGLGNPGLKYTQTRHNAGFLVLDALARDHSIPLDGVAEDARWGTGAIAGHRVALVKPMTFMNQSGPPVLRFVNAFCTSSRETVIIHDDLDLALGRIKFKVKGGSGGHKGLLSLMEAFGDDHFMRLRIGIGRPPAETGTIDHVLGCFTASEAPELARTITRAQEAVVALVCEGLRQGMNKFNRPQITNSD
jgi:peptidyl-tRNA hydrolase, PTH1 family